MNETLKGIWLIILSMFLLNASDALIKLASEQVTFGHIMVAMGLIGTTLTGTYSVLMGRNPLRREMLEPALMMRMVLDTCGACMIFIALGRVDLSLVAVITQASPILIAVFAAIILRETVGWQRWTSIIIGFIGVVLIVNPFDAKFDPNVLFAVGALNALTARDFATRFVSKSINAVEMSTIGFIALAPIGLIVALVDGTRFAPDHQHFIYMLVAIFVGIGGLIAIAGAMRFGDISATAPFRYSRVVFAVIVGYFVFAEWPTPIMWLGIALVIGSGLFLLLRQSPIVQSRSNT
ncbi:MAG: DMT family transporter [Pseudomonadota bacterium]